MSSMAYATPTEHVLMVDGVKCRVWSAVSALGVPMTLLVHRVMPEPEFELALEREFPMLREVDRPKKIGGLES